MPENVGEVDVQGEAADFAQQHDVVSNLSDPFALSRAKMSTLIQCMDRRRRYGAVIEKMKLGSEILLGKRPKSL